MTSNMRETLEGAVRQELRRVEKGEWPASPSTLAALVRHGFLSRSERLSRHGTPLAVWTATTEGKAALKPPERFAVERPRFLSRPGKNTGDYTTDPSKRIDSLEVVGEASLRWRRKSELDKIVAQDRKARARQAAEKARYAA